MHRSSSSQAISPTPTPRSSAHDYITQQSLPRLLPVIERELREAESRRARQHAEAALRASEERFAKAFEYAPIGMALVGIDGTVLKVNRALCGVGLPNVPDGAIFEPSFTTKPDGLGLGLSISRSIVQAHGGDLWARRNAERGATVGFTLPAALR